MAAAFPYTNRVSPFIIGDNTMNDFDGITFTNPELTAGSAYYAFIRLYSSRNVSL